MNKEYTPSPEEQLHIDASTYANNRKNLYVEGMKKGVVKSMSKDALNGRWLAHYEGYREGHWVATGDNKFSTDPANLKDPFINESRAKHIASQLGLELKREWVGLTDEEIYEAVENSNSVLVKDMARAIEAKLKEKNNG
jgi:hypothetical protein